MTDQADKRFPFAPYPKGWFQVAENTVDIARFAPVHGVSGFGDIDVEIDGETGKMSRIGLGFARHFCKQIEQDIPIWEATIYRDRPQLARGEGAITEFRSWAGQSYEEAGV